jgi:predicted GH43/DUF377 family glycosyl hydrolase
VDPIPSITNQGIQARPLISAFHSYNSGSSDGKRFCSRAYDPDQKRSRLIWQRRIDNELIAEEPLDIPGNGSFEDARVFQHDGRNHIAFTEGIYDRTPFLSIQQIAVLGPDWQPEEKITIKYGKNGTKSEKNWQFFSHEGRLHFVYSIVPHIVVSLSTDLKTPLNEYRSDTPLNWPGGEVLRGGTPPIRVGENYLTFFHSHAAHRQRHRRYAMGAYMFDAKPPFKITAISPVLLRASEQDVTLPNPSVPDWDPITIFPVGCWQNHDGGDAEFTVALGVNDSFDALAGIEKIDWQAPGVYSKPQVRYFEADNGPLPILVRGQVAYWKLRKLRSPFYPARGYMATSDPNLISLIESRKDSREISERVFRDYEAGK